MDFATYIIMGAFALASIVYGIVWAVANNKVGEEKEIGKVIGQFQTFVFVALVIGVVGVTIYFS